MMGHKICSDVEIWIIVPNLFLLPFHIWTSGKQDLSQGQDSSTDSALPIT